MLKNECLIVLKPYIGSSMIPEELMLHPINPIKGISQGLILSIWMQIWVAAFLSSTFAVLSISTRIRHTIQSPIFKEMTNGALLSSSRPRFCVARVELLFTMLMTFVSVDLSPGGYLLKL